MDITGDYLQEVKKQTGNEIVLKFVWIKTG
jgi:hypothetical protein